MMFEVLNFIGAYLLLVFVFVLPIVEALDVLVCC